MHGHSAWEPALTGSDDKDYQFYSISEIALIGSDDKDPRVTSFIPTWETVLTQTSTVKNNQRIWEKMKVNGPGAQKLGQGRNCWQRAKHAWLYSDLIQALMGKYLEFSIEGTLIFASAAPDCRSPVTSVSFFSNLCFTSTSCLSSPLLPSSFIIFYLFYTRQRPCVESACVFNCSLCVVE